KIIDKIGVPWPIGENKKGTSILHMNAPMRGKGLFIPSEQELLGENQCSQYPYLLTNGRNLYHYHSSTMT
ncbi:hypothetical protein, partial [Cetobacterium sp.]|uniref:hypothetical protein n=1 Tax=Cetobacterium sp. TaxID=2071632 RepID=UPI002FC835CD